ncbi:MAG TPA: CocE/NonD family hydrolase [Beijerinckiaceae bacterium]
MTTRDGVRLIADVWRPDAPGDHPVLLQRQAYGRRIAATICYAHPAWYAAQGYVVVSQDIRGRGDSEGVFRCGENEIEDGAASVEWAALLPGATGAVGMYGFSYQGYAQFMAAAGDSPSLKAIAPAMLPWRVRDDWAYENGAFRLGGALGWAIQIAAESARKRGDAESFAELAAAAKAPPMDGPHPSRPALMERHKDLSHYHDWLDQPSGSDYWRRISPATHAETLRARALPTLLVAGWHDYMLRGTLAAHRALADLPRTHLVVGPWGHFPWDRRIGAMDYGAEAVSDIDRMQVRFFDAMLKGAADAFADAPRVRLFDVGAKTWRAYDAWPEAAPMRLALAGDGRASIDAGAGRLLLTGEAPTGEEFLVHDPWRPAPSIGGLFGAPPGPVDRSAVDARGDVLTFTSAPLTAPLALAGDVWADIEAWSDAESFDLVVTLSRVAASGQSVALAEAHVLAPSGGGRQVVRAPMRAVCATLQAGEALRLSVAAAAYPAFAVNPGTGEAANRARRLDARIVTIGVATGSASATRLFVTPAQPAA